MEPRFTAKFGVVRGTHLGAKRVAQVVHNPIAARCGCENLIISNLGDFSAVIQPLSPCRIGAPTSSGISKTTL